MNLTTTLKGWLTANCGVAETASDEEFKKAASEAIFTDKISAAKLAELSEDGEPDPDDIIGKAVAKAMEPFLSKMSGALGSPLDQILSTAGRDEPVAATASQKATSILRDGDRRVRVKSPIERYDSTKSNHVYPDKSASGAMHPLAGRPVMFPLTDSGVHVPLETRSQADMAVIGAYTKWLLRSDPANRLPIKFTEHDQELVKYAFHELPFSGYLKPDSPREEDIPGRKLSDFEIKILLDDSSSGGTEAVPLIFDAAIITTPVLYGELFPLVNVIPIARGRRIQGSAISNPTFSSQTEGTAVTPITTDSLIAAFSNTIYPAALAVEIGLDFQEDSPIPIASILVEKAGEKGMEWLDRVIAEGNGTSEPLGIKSTSGISSPSGVPAGGSGAAPQVTDYEKMMFGIGPEYRKGTMNRDRCVYITNDTTYQRSRSIAVGTSDARRVFGMDHQGYSTLGYAHKIAQDLANTEILYANLRYYRMFRRLGLNVRTETAGYTLATRNTNLIIIRMRWAGKMELAGAACYCSTAQA